MLIELSVILVVVGVLMLAVGIFIARQYTLRAKLLTAFLMIVMSSLGVLTLLDGRIMQETLSKSAQQSLTSASRVYANRLDEFNRVHISSIKAESSLPSIVNAVAKIKSDSLQNRRELLRALQSKQNSMVTSYAILNTNGVNVADTRKNNIGMDESTAPYFLEAINTKEPYYSSVVFDDNDEALIYFSSPIIDAKGAIAGVLRASHKAEVLERIIMSARGLAGQGSFAILLDENLLRLVHGRRNDLQYTLAEKLSDDKIETLHQQKRIPSVISNNDAEDPIWLEGVRSAAGSANLLEANFYGLGTVPYLASVVKLESTPWSLIFAQPQDVFLQPMDEQLSSSLILAATIAVVVILIMLGVTQFLLGPIRRLTDVVQTIGKGDFKVIANVEADDEVGGLAKAFNSMTLNINELVVNLESEIEQHKLTADHLRKLSQAIEHSPVLVMITDLKGEIEYVNPQFCKVTGYSAEEVIGKNPRFLSSGSTPSQQYASMWNAMQEDRIWSGEIYNKKKNGQCYWENMTISPVKNVAGVKTHYLAIKEDITLRKDYEDRLLYQASYDKLTDLPNRSLAYDRLQHALATATRMKKHVAVMYLDFDHFKNINDTLGHAAGDKFLIKMAGRLTGCVRDVDTVARLGGDEFLIVLAEIGNDDSEGEHEYEAFIQQKTREILERVSQPCTIDNMEFSVTVSIGVALYPRDGDDPHMLLRNADTAMYRSKSKGRNTFELFSPEMSDTVFQRLEIETRLRYALENKKFNLKYQPLMAAHSRKIVGAEALIRWEDEELGKVSPEIFIPFAEESGLIVGIGEWVLDTACRDIRQLQDEGYGTDFYFAINLSSRQIRDKDFSGLIAAMLIKHGISGDCLELEITERLLMKDVPEVVTTLNSFKEMKVRLSIDDFGTGYSSLSYLKRFPFDVLKIDQSFVRDIGKNADDTALCEAIIAMAHSLGLSLIAEGVETREQYEFLRERGTEIVQGYYMGKPTDFAEFRELLGCTLEYC
ncbi:MAG: EAL domain-containing protein [Gammaproteobacteria bacterium]|jgi:diguanylate cyclase (GGDEF)-like protein/PAS domain S-box-containing protein|nr:EAL domain-containing protein [Gammaproteobacteria bacterium]